MSADAVLLLCRFLQPLMKELVNLGSQFIGFRDEAAALRGKTLLFLTCYMSLS